MTRKRTVTNESFSEVEHVGWFQRITSSIGGAVIGIILFLVAFPLLIWNEGHAVDTARKLSKGQGEVISVPIDRVNEDNDGKLIHVTGPTRVDAPLSDLEFGVSARALRLKRVVEVYQWKEESQTETKKKLGGGEDRVTTYNYTKAWSSDLIDSNKFKKPVTPSNPGSKPYLDVTMDAPVVKLGAFVVHPTMTGRIVDEVQVPFTNEMLAKLPSEMKTRLRVRDGILYRGSSAADSDEPQIGDLRIEFREVQPATVSVVARQKNKMLSPDTGGVGQLLKVGTYSADELFQAAKQELSLLTWLLRLVGFVLIAFGIGLVFQPLVIFADFVPFLGNLVGLGVGMFALGIAFALSVITIALSWLAFRPLYGIGLLVVAGGVVAAMVMLSHQKQAAIDRK
jgi:hypothetical protein